MKTMNTVTANVIVLLAWAAAVALVYNLLSGPFDGRMCESVCFSIVYNITLVLAVTGTLLSLAQILKANAGIVSKLAFLLGLLLTGMLMGVMVIGLAT